MPRTKVERSESPERLDTTFTAIDPEAFKGGFSEAGLLAYLAKDVLKTKLGTGNTGDGAGTAYLQAKLSLDRVQKLIGTLDR